MLLGHLSERLQALQQAWPNVDGVNGRPGGLAGSCEKPSLGGLNVSSLCSQANPDIAAKKLAGCVL